MDFTSKTIHTARLNNNCPECFGTDGLEIIFTQPEKENLFYRKPSSKIDEKLYCHTCKNTIYPISWTADIERVYDYNKKIAESNRQYLKVKPALYIAILLTIIVVAVVIYFLIKD